LDDKLLDVIRSALGAVQEPRYFETERGYQAELYCELRARLKALDFGDAEPILEQEYQKRTSQHGLTLRPDILVHEPFNPSKHPDRTHGNYVVIELKLDATDQEAREDFAHLAEMMRRLSYPLGVFVNVAAVDTKIAQANRSNTGRIVAFAVSLKDGRVNLREDAI
jgi:hypothetical protein